MNTSAMAITMTSQVSKCTCGNNVKHEHANEQPHSLRETNNPLDASFVHLPAPAQIGHNVNGSGNGVNVNVNGNLMQDQMSDEGDLYNQGILNSYRHINMLLRVAEGHLDVTRTGTCSSEEEGIASAGAGTCLCVNCVERIASAMEDNTARLEAEIEAYDAAVKNEQDKQRRLLKALSINAGINQDEAFETSIHIQYADEEILQNALDTLDDELKRLQITNQEHESELQKMNELLQDRVRIAQTLTEQEDEVLTEFNSLEVDARVFQDIHRHFTHQCHAAEREKFHLSRVQLHSALFHIDVDERGLRYPLINNLRLAHKPSSRGISWLEINAAWSQAAQLLMFVGSTIKFKSKDLRIVPLMSCAKIIEVGSNGDTRFVNHLGVDFQAMNRKTHGAEHMNSSVRAFHTLLYQMYVHILNSKAEVDCLDPAPFELRQTVIGSHDLGHIDDRDDVGWSGVIHCIASYMKWMSQNACKFIRYT